MKKVIAVFLLVIMTVSITACGNNSELEHIKKENEQLKQQIQGETSEEKSNENTSSTQQTTSDLELVEQKKSDNQPPSEYVYADFIVKNITGNDINCVSLTIKELDADGNIVDATYPQVDVTVAPNQTVNIIAVVPSTVHSLQLDSYSYYDGNSKTDISKFKEGKFDSNIEKLSLQ